MYLKKHKTQNKFKVIADLSDFSIQDFTNFELYDATVILEDEFKNRLKDIKIKELTAQLADLGVDLSKPKETVVSPQIKSNNKTQEPTSEIKNIQADNNGMGRITEEEMLKNLSEVNKPNTDTFYTNGELRQHYASFKEQIEKDIKEIVYSSVTEKGIFLHMTETRRDLPIKLPNGIPLIQVVV